LWEQSSAITEHLDAAQLSRIRQTGLTPLPSERGLELFSSALARRTPNLVPALIDTGRLRAAAGGLPPILSALVRVRRTAAAATASGPSLQSRLAGLGAEQRRALVQETVLADIATVLGHGAQDTIGLQRTFKELGFDSLTAVELRNRLNRATGLRLSATLVFDHPTPAALAAHVADELAPADGAQERPPALAELDRLEAALTGGPLADEHHRTVTARLQALLRTLSADESGADLETATDDELFDALDSELGF
ncbi:phosphopantetheine-binding protein, partial [Kitasatospora sp. NPDC056327]|uniref:phosphopantetheine-binding protein n=1 Tax=Kitasatospora sp. NPDC056327 TaxID=3345785 RepID=UPI0035D683F9